jgi:hypothetical protein
MNDPAFLTPDTQAAYRLLRDFSEQTGHLRGFQLAETLRTCARQNELYAQGPTVTRARGCISWHVHGRAFDLTAPGMTCDNIRPLGEFWESIGGKWGGRFGDCVHFEWHPGYNISELCYAPDTCGFRQMPLIFPGHIPSRKTQIAAVALAVTVAGLYLLENKRLWRRRQS